MSFEAQTQDSGELRIVSIAGDVDERAARDFQTLLLDSSGGDDRSLLLDFGDLEWMSGLSLRAVVTLNRRLVAEGRRLAVCALGERIEKALDVSGLKHLLPIFTCRSEASDWLTKSARTDRVCRLAGRLLHERKESSAGRESRRQRHDFGTQRLAAVAAELLGTSRNSTSPRAAAVPQTPRKPSGS